jgi:eukaryotic-like serine/threonine-protein kinase
MGSYTRERWAVLSELLCDTLLLPEDEQESYLATRCGDDALLKAEVSRLLRSHREAEATARFSRGALDLVPLAFPETKPPPNLGPYRLVKEIGRGGMGSVWLAERVDGVFDQKVAVKIMQAGLFPEESQRRFEGERRILARLHHPNIARILDGGVASSGQLYLVMEFVEARTITDYCRDRVLTVDDRLRLFLTVCETVAYAHQNLIVHRDLKPSNILVTDAGDVKLLDFGIAKLLDDDAGSSDSEPTTRTGMSLMTPEYAAPEQVSGGDITTATDVYQLGVLLYELLVGRRPYDLKGLMPGAVERLICAEEPTRPSTACVQAAGAGAASDVDGERLRRRLSGDLDTIVLKALRKEPERRYGSVELLAEDIRRHQSNLPVHARPDTARYRTSRFIRRHRIAVAATALVSILLTATLFLAIRFAFVTSAHADALAIERDRAQVEATKAEQINVFLQGLLSAPDPFSDGREVRVVDVLAGAAERVALELRDQPHVAAAVHRTLGITYQNLGLYEEGESQLQQALNLRRANPATATPELAESLKDVALVKHWQGQLDSARTYYLDALRLYRQAGEPGIGFAEALNDYGTLLLEERDYAGAAPLLREANRMYTLARDGDHADVIANLNNMALVEHGLGNLAGADSLYREVLALQRRTVGSDHPDVAIAMNNLGWLQLEMGYVASADSLFRGSLELRRVIHGETHPSVGLMHTNIAAMVLMPQERFTEADSMLRVALTIFAASVPGDHQYTASALYALGMVLARRGRVDEAEVNLSKALIMRRQLFGTSHPFIAAVEFELGGVYLTQRRYAEAELTLRSAIANASPQDEAFLSNARERLAEATRLSSR